MQLASKKPAHEILKKRGAKAQTSLHKRSVLPGPSPLTHTIWKLTNRPKFMPPAQLASCWCIFYSLLASGDFCHLLITFANSFDPDQDRRYVGPGQDPTVRHSDSVSKRTCFFFKKLILKEVNRWQQKHEYPACKLLRNNIMHMWWVLKSQ